MFKHLQKDLPASIVVFLVALPLCLGIALASGVPLIAGLKSGIIGGIVVGMLSKSPLSVSGPAAGLVVIVLNAIDGLGSFEAFLLAVCLAGILQWLLGMVKAGMIGMYFPSSVIKGMLAAIGLILILKQFPHLVGFDSDAFGEMEFMQPDGENTFSALFAAFSHVLPGSLVVGLGSLALLILWEQPFIKRQRLLKMMPGGVLAVVFGLILNAIFQSVAPQWTIGAAHLVSIPIFSGDDLGAVLTFPDFSAIANYNVYITALTLAIVASLETLLSIEAVDKLDPHKRTTPKNRELKAQGIGNIMCGLTGGLPITAVIVRSSANVDSGAQSKSSAIMHGILLILAVGLFPRFMNTIPLASLAAILVVVGYKLCKPSLFKTLYRQGRDVFLPFVITVIAILLTDLLIGILIGMGVGFFYIVQANYKVPFEYSKDVVSTDGRHHIQIRLSEYVSFLNKANLQRALYKIPENSEVTIDGSGTRYIDHDALEEIYNFRQYATEHGMELKLADIPALDQRPSPSTFKQSTREVQTQEV